MLNILPHLNNIFDFVSKIVFDSPYISLSNSYNINPLNKGISISSINNNKNDNITNNYENIKNYNDIGINNINNISINNNKINNREMTENSTKTKESLFPNIQELKQFFDINKKIFSSSELIKYRIIYEGLPISKLLKIFKDICDNIKKTISNSKVEYDSDVSDYDDSKSNIFEEVKHFKETENSTYHIVNQKIFEIKKLEFYHKIFMELLKNYLVSFEIIVNQIEKEIQNKDKQRQCELGEELNILYNIFEDAVYYKMDRLDDDVIFNRKIILKLLLNHKEYLSIIYDI